MPTTYTDETDKRLLIAIFQELKLPNPNGAQWESIATKLGPDFLPGGISQRFSKKLMKMDVSTGNTATGGTPATPATGKRKASQSEDTPSKKTPRTKTAKTTKKSEEKVAEDEKDTSTTPTEEGRIKPEYSDASADIDF